MKRTLAVALLLFLAGCAGSTQLVDDPARKKVTSVTLSPTVTKPAQMHYFGPGNAPALMFGLIGGAIAAPGLERERKGFQSDTEKTGISIESIVREEVAAAIRKSGKLAVSDTQPGGATLTVSILQYGFSVPSGFSSKLVPVLYLKCDLADASGKVLWSASDRLLTIGNPVEPVTPEAMQKDPKVIEASWRAAAKHIADGLMSLY